MSRTRKTLVAATFSYTQFATGILAAIVLTPLILSHVGSREYGIWLAGLEALGYAAMADVGVFAVLPWMFAKADGQRDPTNVRRLLAHGLLMGMVVGLAYAAMAGLFWFCLPDVLNLAEKDRALIGGPMAVLAALIAAGFPLRVFSALRIGLQDVWFNGTAALVQFALSVGITIVLLLNGFGLHALAAAAAFPPLLTALAALLRTAWSDRSLLQDWPRPTFSDCVSLLREGLGAWFSSFGVQMVWASSALIIVYLGHPEWVIIYWCTARMSHILLQLSWVLPDSSLPGLAQLHGEGRVERVREVIATTFRLNLVLASGAALVVLTTNAVFVPWWVGHDYYGGWWLNSLFGIGVIGTSIVHGIVSPAAVIGNRLRVGVNSMLGGLAYVGMALTLGAQLGLEGLALAAPLSGLLVIALPTARLLGERTGITWRAMTSDALGSYAFRFTPLVAAAGLFPIAFPEAAATALFVSLMLVSAHLWLTQNYYLDLTVQDSLRQCLGRLRPLQIQDPAKAKPVEHGGAR